MVFVQVDARKTAASSLAQVEAEVSEEDELQEAEEVSRFRSRGQLVSETNPSVCFRRGSKL